MTLLGYTTVHTQVQTASQKLTLLSSKSQYIFNLKIFQEMRMSNMLQQQKAQQQQQQL